MKSIIIAAFLAMGTISCNNDGSGSGNADTSAMKADSTNAIDNTGTGTVDTGMTTTDTTHKMNDTSRMK